MMKINHKHIALLVMVGAMTLTRCTDDFKEVDAPSGTTITNVVADDSNLDIFSAGLVKTGLSVTLDNNNAGAFTAFAPSDDAFVTYFKTALAKGDPYTEDSVLTYINTKMSPSSTIKTSDFSARLTYHLVSSKIPSSALTGNQVFTTMNSARLSVSKQTDVMLNASAKVTAVDAEASNGVVHTIDKVLSPVSTATALGTIGITAVSYATNPPTITGGSATAGDATGTDYDIFAYALVKTGLVPTLQPNKSPLPDFTFFVPTDDAMRAYLTDNPTPPAATADLENASINIIKGYNSGQLEALANILKQHIVAGRVLTSDLADGQTLTTLMNGENLTFAIDGSIVVNGVSTIQSKNVLTNAGVIHSLNMVLLP